MSGEWRRVVGHPGYEVNDQGNVRSLDRVLVNRDGVRRHWRGRILKPAEIAVGRTPKKLYRVVRINGRLRKVAVLVLEAFVGPKPFPKAVSRHLNDDSLDDRLGNLAWGSKQEDADDRGRNGRQAKGERIGNAKLTEADVLAIRAAYAAGGVTQRELSEQYGVVQPDIGYITTRKIWRHI